MMVPLCSEPWQTIISFIHRLQRNIHVMNIIFRLVGCLWAQFEVLSVEQASRLLRGSHADKNPPTQTLDSRLAEGQAGRLPYFSGRSSQHPRAVPGCIRRWLLIFLLVSIGGARASELPF